MRRAAVIVLAALAMLLGGATVSLAARGGGHGGGYHGGFHHGGRFHTRVFVGPGWWGWGYGYPYPYWYGWYSPPPPYAGYAYPPLYDDTGPQSYVQQSPPPAPEAYWYYCPSARAYYPDVRRCAEAWVKVPPRPSD
jgi:hypothetical protein